MQVSEVAQPRTSGSSGIRQRKQTRPRRVVNAVQVPQVQANVSDEPQGGGEQQERPSEAAPNPRECLLAVQEIVATRIPNEQSLDRLKQFLSDNQPCDPQQVS
jgi:hypothetical protein